MKDPKSKCRNEKTVFDGIKFDSKLECERYKFLKQRQERGMIRDLRVHVTFPIIEKSKHGRQIKYVCDFSYMDCVSGRTIVEDVKSPYTAKLPVYRLKKRLFAEKYHIEITEVFSKWQQN